MAKTSKIVRDRQRREIVARHAERRAELKEAARTAATPEERAAAQAALERLPRDASPTRLRNRDTADGRPRGHLRKFGLREPAAAGRRPARGDVGLGTAQPARQLHRHGPATATATTTAVPTGAAPVTTPSDTPASATWPIPSPTTGIPRCTSAPRRSAPPARPAARRAARAASSRGSARRHGHSSTYCHASAGISGASKARGSVAIHRKAGQRLPRQADAECRRRARPRATVRLRHVAQISASPHTR